MMVVTGCYMVALQLLQLTGHQAQTCRPSKQTVSFWQVMKKPGQDNVPVMSEMDLTYKERYTEAYIPEAYERLILDAIRGDQQHFVRRYAANTSNLVAAVIQKL